MYVGHDYDAHAPCQRERAQKPRKLFRFDLTKTPSFLENWRKKEKEKKKKEKKNQGRGRTGETKRKKKKKKEKKQGALVTLAEEIAKSAIPEGSRKINGKYIQSHLLSRLEAVHVKLEEQIKDVDVAQSKEVHLFWTGMAESVQVMGTFDGWSQGEHLSPKYTGSFTKFSTTLMLRPGRYHSTESLNINVSAILIQTLVSVLKVMLLVELVLSIDGDSCLPWWIGLANSDKVIIDSVGGWPHGGTY
ncbi:protein PTST, chloroplastic isoform X2 [Fagus crenata]